MISNNSISCVGSAVAPHLYSSFKGHVGHEGGGGAMLTSSSPDTASPLAEPEAAASLDGAVVPDPAEPLPLLLPLPLLAMSPLLLIVPLPAPPSTVTCEDASSFGSSPGSAAHAPAPTSGAKTTSMG